jgi:integrase
MVCVPYVHPGERLHVAKLLTDAAVRKYVPGPKRRRIKDSTPGLALVIEPSGFKAFEMRFRVPSGRIGKIRLGPYDLSGRDELLRDQPQIGQPLSLTAARLLAAKVHQDRKKGIDVIADHKAAKHRRRAEIAERAATSFAACLHDFIVEHRVAKWGTRPRRWRETARTLGLNYPPGSDPAITQPQVIKGSLADIWDDRAVAEIDDHLIHEIVRDAGKHGIPGLGRRNRGVSDARKRALHAALATFFGWLKKERKIASNPVIDVERPAPPAARERTLGDRELRWFWRAANVTGEPFAALLKILALSGARLNSVAGMRRSELDDDGTWNLPATRSKNHRVLALPLPALAREIIAAVPGKPGSDLVFSTTGRSPVSGWSRMKRRLDKAMLDIAKQEKPDAVIEKWRLHDVRRSAASGMQRLGVRTEVVERTLGHLSGSFRGVSGTYQRDPLTEEVRAALALWSSHIESLVSGRPAKVLPLKKAKH